MKPVFFVTRNYPPTKGGIESMADEILGDAVNTYPNEIILIHIGQRTAHTLPQNLRGYYHLPGNRMGSTLFFSTLGVFTLALLLRPRLIINMQVTTALGAHYASRLLRIPHRVIALGLEVMEWPQASFEWVKKTVFHHCSAVVSISHFTQKLVLHYKLDSNRSHVLHPGVRPDNFFSRKKKNTPLMDPDFTSEKFICLFAGRLHPRKGADKCIESINIIKDSHPNVRLVIAGTGPDESRLKSMVDKFNLSKFVKFSGFVSDETLSHFYSQADLFLMPSRQMQSPPESEGFGIVFLEAAAAGLPCIGSTEGGVPDAVAHEETGFNVDPHDEKALADLIRRLITEPELARKMGENGRKRVLEQFDWKNQAPKFTRILFNAE